MKLATTIQDILDCCVTELDPAPGRVIIVPGLEVAWDDPDCDGGILYARIPAVYPTREFPNVDTVALPCPNPRMASMIAVGMVRCLHGIERLDQGEGPTAGELTSDAIQMIADMEALYRGIQCCDDSDDLRLVGQWSALGPQGGMAGGEWIVYLDRVSMR